MQLSPYLHFDGRTEEAIQFYKSALGAEMVMMLRFKESPDQSMVAPGTENKIMHATLRLGESTFHVSDGHCKGQANFDGITLNLTVKTDAEAQKAFAALSNGGKVCMPLSKTFFSSSFGMVNDPFGVPWMVYVATAP